MFVIRLPCGNSQNMDPHRGVLFPGKQPVANHRGNDNNRSRCYLGGDSIQFNRAVTFEDGVDLGAVAVIVCDGVLDSSNMEVESKLIATCYQSCT